MNDNHTVLTVSGLTKRYASVTVLDQCELRVRSGEIHALLGANGAGKSTLVKLIAGLIQPDDGTMQFCGRPYAPHSKQAAESAGVEIVQQELNLIPTLSVAENLQLARLPSLLGIIRRPTLETQTRQALARVGLTEIDPSVPVASLGVGQQQLVEIAAALDRQCQLLILDEPTAALSAAESRLLFEQLQRLRDEGVGMIYISHRMEEITAMADRITVLRDGQFAGVWNRDQLSAEELVRQTTGDTSSAGDHAFQSHRTDECALQVHGLSTHCVHNVSFRVNRGERLGITGLAGSGRTELLRAIFGADTADDGHIQLADDTSARRFQHPRDAVAAGVAMVTEDRKQNGLLLPQSIQVNTTLNTLERFSRLGVVRHNDEAQAASSVCDMTGVQRVSDEQAVGTLSGGNQQKVVVSKWLLRDGHVFLLDEPTRGIDVAARRRIWLLIESLSEAGKAMVVVSSDLEELLDHCDRIAVMAGGELIQTFHRPDWSHDRIMQAAFARSGIAAGEKA